MPDQSRGDDVYQPEHSDVDNPPVDDLDPQNALDPQPVDEALEHLSSPPEQPLAADAYGTTGEEQEEGESLDQKLAQEEPDTGA